MIPDISRKRFTSGALRHCALAAAVLLASFASAAQPEIANPAEELRVYGAIVAAASTGQTNSWILIGSQTATFECNPPAAIGLDVGGCTGMRVAPETAEERLGTVASDLPQTSKEMLAEIRRNNQTTQEIVGPIPTTRTYVLWSPKSSGFPDTVRGNPELALYLSRVAFSADGSRALVYMGTMNWTDNSKSMGQYVILNKEGSEWKLTGHSLVWSLH